MSEVDEILEMLEADRPREGIERAQSHLSEADPGAEDRTKIVYGIAAAFFKLGEYDETHEWLDRSDSPRRWMLRGFTHLQQQEPGEAAEAFLESARQYPRNENEALLMGAQSRALNEEYDEARSHLDSLLEADLDEDIQAEVYLNRALVELEDEQHRQARSWLEKTIERFEESPFAVQAGYHLVVVLEQLGQVEPALERLGWLEDRAEDPQLREAIGELKSRLMKQRNDRSSQLREYEY